MPTPSKFTAARRKIILEALRVGASRNTASALAGIDHKQLQRWLERGKDAAEGTSWRTFYEEAMAEEAHPRHRALGIIYNEMPDKPDLAWKFVERREPGYAPPMPVMASQPAGPVIVQLSFSGRTPIPQLAAAEVIEGEVVDEPDDGQSPPA